MRARQILVLAATLMFSWFSSAVGQTTVSMVAGPGQHDLKAVFSSTDVAPVWELDVYAAEGYIHKVAYATSLRWVGAAMHSPLATFKCMTILQPAELRFQGRIFKGELEPINPRGGGGKGDLAWTVTGKTLGYYVAPDDTVYITPDKSAAFFAFDNSSGVDIPDDSTWTLIPQAGTAGTPLWLPDGPSVTIPGTGLLGEYYVQGISKNGAGTDYGELCVIPKVEITGFSLSPTWACGNECNVTNHQSTCQATIQPSGVSTITYSISGDTHGATIDANTGTVTPSIVNSGSITVRAAATVFPSYFAESNLLICAHPVAIAKTTKTTNEDPEIYGANYTHTFNGTGGSLKNVEISEVMIIATNPFNDPWPGVPNPGLPNVWILDDAGTMDAADSIITEPNNVNINSFLPHPPKAGLPAVYNTPQTLYWRCPPCNDWKPFMNVGVTRTLQGTASNFIFITTDNGVSTNQPYTGPALNP